MTIGWPTVTSSVCDGSVIVPSQRLCEVATRAVGVVRAVATATPAAASGISASDRRMARFCIGRRLPSSLAEAERRVGADTEEFDNAVAGLAAHFEPAQRLGQAEDAGARRGVGQVPDLVLDFQR